MIPVFDKKLMKEVGELLSAPRKIVITTHFKPDGDAIGSLLGLSNYLVMKKHKVKPVVPSGYPEFISWMNGDDKILNFERKPKFVEKVFEEADIIICLDFNDPARVEGMKDLILNSKAKKILIDHHLQPMDFCDYTFSFPQASSTCELVYHFIDQLGDGKKINKHIAECIYTGILTDTGSFRFAGMTADTHRIIAALMDTGMNHVKIHELIYDTFTEERTRFLGFCIKDKMQIIHTYNTAYIALSKAEMDMYHNRSGDTEGIVNYPLNVKGIKMSAIFTEREDCIKISLRSKGDFSVRDFANKYFNGGGHKNASGGKSFLSLDETVEKFIAALEDYKDQLQA